MCRMPTEPGRKIKRDVVLQFPKSFCLIRTSCHLSLFSFKKGDTRWKDYIDGVIGLFVENEVASGQQGRYRMLGVKWVNMLPISDMFDMESMKKFWMGLM